MERFAVAYRVREKLIIGSVVRTSMGVGLEVDPITLELTSSNDFVAEAINKAFARSSDVVPHPAQDQWKELFKPFEVAAEVRSYKAFMSNARSVALSDDRAQLILTPQRNLGIKEGFEPAADDTVVLPSNYLQGAAASLKMLLMANGS